ncbi:putative pao retrotransposon peptidase superfamily [Trichonephila clavata]|uniref:Putative pao retrotransposon peptidase superfamily n=1 Tax=Trichonephila clavata TaxID=2740835 RepID=A0A8X6JCC3_TRICU|nr:putative pao retrotransposon peptidase superfamily [Trichonephila clavata]
MVGGFYERLMRSIKEPLRKIIGRANLTFEETMTILAEIENVLNHRPLTYVSDDVSDPEPLTPANFLLIGHKNDYPFNFSELLNNSITRESLLKRNTKSKLLWDLGRIAKVMQGRDGLVRSCVIKTKKGEFKRPVQLIYPLNSVKHELKTL